MFNTQELQDISDCLDIRASLYQPHRATSRLPFIICLLIESILYKSDVYPYVFEARNLAQEIIGLDNKYIDSRMIEQCQHLIAVLN